MNIHSRSSQTSFDTSFITEERETAYTYQITNSAIDRRASTTTSFSASLRLRLPSSPLTGLWTYPTLRFLSPSYPSEVDAPQQDRSTTLCRYCNSSRENRRRCEAVAEPEDGNRLFQNPFMSLLQLDCLCSCIIHLCSEKKQQRRVEKNDCSEDFQIPSMLNSLFLSQFHSGVNSKTIYVLFSYMISMYVLGSSYLFCF